MKRVLFILFVLTVKQLFTQENTLRLPAVYSDNMVLQRGMPLKIAGEAGAGLKVVLHFNGRQYTAIAGNDKKWEIVLDPVEAGGPYTLEVMTVTDTLRFCNVMAGEVWLCSGQSNMAFMLKQDIGFETIKGENPQVRFYDMKPRWETYSVSWNESVLDSLNRFDYFKETGWTTCTQATAKEFSAIAYSFGKMLADSLGVPVGLILNAVGGSPIEAWIDKQTLESGFPEISGNWRENELIQDWVRERATLNIAKAKSKEQKHPYEPCYLFEAAIRPLHSYAVRGIVWYQGESNVHERMNYDKLFPLLVNSWRTRWNNDELPFYYVQLSGIDRPLWPEFRDVQRKFMREIPYVYMAVSSDKGDSLDVHPPEKLEIGRRLGLWALNKSYGRTTIVPSGPLYRSVELRKTYAYVSFDYSSGMKTSDGKRIRTFEVAGPDGLYHQAEAIIEGGRVKVWSEKVNDIQRVRYAWQPFTRANLVNGACLPASTFKTENKTMELNQMIESLPDYPVKGGVAAPFIGVHRNHLIVAGGCNFPDAPASAGGKKVFYNEIYTLDLSGNKTGKQWEKATPYPFGVAYGAYVNTPEGIVCIGGQHEEGISSTVMLIQYDDRINDVVLKSLPPLPVSHFNGGAVVVNHTLFVAGGVFSDNENPVYSLSLNTQNAGWQKIKAGAMANRQQPVLFTQADQLFLAGGYDEEKALVYTDVLKFNFETSQWENYDSIMSQADLPFTFVGTAAVNLTPDTTLFIGGVNYERFYSALQRIKRTGEAVEAGNTVLADSFRQAGKEYMSQPPEWYRFQPLLISYEPREKQWTVAGESTILARAGAGVCLWNNKLYVVGGELKPGVRTEEACCLNFDKE